VKANRKFPKEERNPNRGKKRKKIIPQKTKKNWLEAVRGRKNTRQKLEGKEPEKDSLKPLSLDVVKKKE